MKRQYIFFLSYHTLIQSCYTFIAGFFSYFAYKYLQSIAVLTSMGSQSTLSFQQIIHSPKDLLLPFMAFILLLLFLSNLSARSFLFFFHYFTLLGFIMKFSLLLWSVAILSTALYVAFHFMSSQGLFILVVILLIHSLAYVAKNVNLANE